MAPFLISSCALLETGLKLVLFSSFYQRSMGNRSKSQNAIEILKKRKMVRFFGGDSSAQDTKGSDGLGPKEEKCRSGFFVSMLSKYDEGRRSESDLAKRTKVRPPFFVTLRSNFDESWYQLETRQQVQLDMVESQLEYEKHDN